MGRSCRLGCTASSPRCPLLYGSILAIEQIPLAAEESADPKRDMPKGIMLGMFTLIALGVPRSHHQPGDPDHSAK